MQVVEEAFFNVKLSPTVPAAIFGAVCESASCEAVQLTTLPEVVLPVPLVPVVLGAVVEVVVGVVLVLVEVVVGVDLGWLEWRAGTTKYAVAPAAAKATRTTSMVVPRILPAESRCAEDNLTYTIIACRSSPHIAYLDY